MRIFLKIVFILFVFFGCSEKVEQNKHIKSSGIMLGEFSVDGMMCERGCKSYIANQVNKLEGVGSCNIDYDHKVMSVEYNLSTINADKIIKHVNSLIDGQYTAQLIKEKSVGKPEKIVN